MSNPADQQKRTGYLLTLFEAFPSGVTGERRTLCGDATRFVRPEDLGAAVQYLIDTRERTTLPSIAELKRVCREQARKRASETGPETEPHRRMTEDEREQCRMVSELGRRGVTFHPCLEDFVSRPVPCALDMLGWDERDFEEYGTTRARAMASAPSRAQIHAAFEAKPAQRVVRTGPLAEVLPF